MYGFEVTLKTTFNPDDYEYSHSERNCRGNWKLIEVNDVPYCMDTLGIMNIPRAMMVQCEQCKSCFFLDGFEEWIRKVIAAHIVTSKHRLGGHELRFLRQLFELKQTEITEAINMESVSLYSKCENNKEILGADKQVRLKVHYAYLFGIKDPHAYHTMNQTTTQQPLVPPKLLRDCVLEAFDKAAQSLRN
jgi:hypothetical protein